MMYIRPVERDDLPQLMALAGKTGGGLTSLPADSKTLAARIERSIQTAGYAAARRAGLCLCAGGQRNPRRAVSAPLRWRSVCRTSVQLSRRHPVHASKELDVYNNGDAVAVQRSYRQQRTLHAVP